MPENKFKFRDPQNTKERIEAIYEELRATKPEKYGYKPEESLKDLVTALLCHYRSLKIEQKLEKEFSNDALNYALGILAFIAILFLMNGSDDASDIEWLNIHHFAIKLWGIALASVYVGISIERSSFFQHLWRFGFTKVVVSIAVSALIVFCTGKASSLINAVFGVDTAVFPYTRAYISGFLFFKYASPILFIVGIFALVHAFEPIRYVLSRYRENYKYISMPWDSCVFLVLAIIVLGFSWRWLNNDFAEQALPAKIYILAHSLDFNLKHPCSNLQDGVNVVFVGSDHSKVLVDTNHIEVENIENFFDERINANLVLPRKFMFSSCEIDKY